MKSIDCSKSQKEEEKRKRHFKEYMNLVADKKCPDGFKFDSKLQVCVPKRS